MTVADLARATETAGVPEGPGRAQGAVSPKGVQHTDFRTLYSKEKTVDLFKQNFRITARAAGRSLDISSVVEQLTWTDQSADQYSLLNINLALTGSIQLRKPSLNQYKQLIAPALSATVADGTSKFGALGAQIFCEVGYGKTFTPIWVMRVQTTADGSGEAINLQDGTWTLSLADDLFQIGLSQDNWKFTAGKKVHKLGWRCDQIAAQVCQQYSIPVKQLTKGTAWISLPPGTTSGGGGTSPSTLIADAYQAESDKTGKIFVMRWSAPDAKFPSGGLEVVPMRRNPNLLKFRDQLTNAALARDTSGDFATVIEATGVIKKPHGKHEKKTYVAKSDAAIKRFGYIHKLVDFKTVNSELELQILAKRKLALRMTPLRTAELTHPGIATVRAGDAIRIDLPEEGYAETPLDVYGKSDPQQSGSKKYSVLALQQAQSADPSMFGLPDPSAYDATSAAALATTTSGAVNADSPTAVLVADQGIAFVMSIAHTVSAGTYSMDMTTGFVDLLDPMAVQAEAAAVIRQAKVAAAAAKGQTSTASTGATGSGTSGTLTMYDTASTDAKGSVPTGNPDAVAGYVDGSYVSYGALVAAFPNAKHLSISVQATDSNKADCLDVEPGDATADQAGGWARRMVNLGVWKPCIYCGQGDLAGVTASMKAAGFSRDQYRLWLAHWTGVASIPAGWDAIQYTSSTAVDTSLMGPGFFQ